MVRFGFVNNLRIAFATLRSNKKTIILTTVGLTIALSISFQMLLFLIGSKGALMSAYLSGSYPKGLWGDVLSDESTNLDIGPDIEIRINHAGLPSNELDLEVEQDITTILAEEHLAKHISSSRLCSF
ncbi:MAG: hypothetical protein ACFFDW_09575, partial [Candidatus Thorarchaeota archaeon]